MSLGLNFNRPGRAVSNSMLGSVAASSVMAQSASAQFARSNVKQHAQSSTGGGQSSNRPGATRTSIHTDAITSRRLDYVESQVKLLTTAVHEAKSSTATPPAPVDDMYAVFGTASRSIANASGVQLADAGAAVKLVYPMKKEGDRTMMRLMAVDPVTAQLAYHWVTVFEMVDGEAVRHVVDFRVA
jgi:hypothetical protein